MNEDTLQNTYTAAIRDMIEDAYEIMDAIKESAVPVTETKNKASPQRTAADQRIHMTETPSTAETVVGGAFCIRLKNS